MAAGSQVGCRKQAIATSNRRCLALDVGKGAIVTAVTSLSNKVGEKKTQIAVLAPLERSVQLRAAIVQSLQHRCSACACSHCGTRRAAVGHDTSSCSRLTLPPFPQVSRRRPTHRGHVPRQEYGPMGRDGWPAKQSEQAVADEGEQLPDKALFRRAGGGAAERCRRSCCGRSGRVS